MRIVEQWNSETEDHWKQRNMETEEHGNRGVDEETNKGTR